MRHFIKPLFAFTLLAMLFSCGGSDSDTPGATDTTGPVISTITPTDKGRVKGVVSVHATAEDLSNDVLMNIAIDEKLVKEEKTKDLTVSIDTRQFSEGKHILKVSATDAAKNTSVKTLEINIRNTLFTLNVPSKYVPEGTTIYYVLSKNDGSVMAVNKITNGTVVSVATPDDFNPDSTFVVTQYLDQDFGVGVRYLIHNTESYTGIKAGDFSLPDFSSSLAQAGQHQLEVSDITVPPQGIIVGEQIQSMTGLFGNGSDLSQTVFMKKSVSDLFIVLGNKTDGFHYKYLNAINAGGATQLSFSNFGQFKQQSVALAMPAENYAVSVYSATLNMQPLFQDNGTNGGASLQVYYPEGTFPSYQFELVSGDYAQTVFGAKPPAAFEYLNAKLEKFAYADRRINAETSGNFDVMRINASVGGFNNANDEYRFHGYSVIFPAGAKHKVRLPQVPAELSNHNFKSPDEFVFNAVILAEYPAISGSEEYQVNLTFSWIDGAQRPSIARTERRGKIVNSGRVRPQLTHDALEKVYAVNPLMRRVGL